MHSKTLPAAIILLAVSCQAGTRSETSLQPARNDTGSNPYSFVKQIPLPPGYQRVINSNTSFGHWLRNVSLKKNKTVYLFNGDKKANQSAQFAVLDISVGDQDLQQCADAVMRLRAEYLFHTGQFEAIRFKDNAGKTYSFTAPYSKAHLQQYLLTVFGMCGSASLSKQLHPVQTDSVQSGDVFIRGGFPGHAEIVMDVAENKEGKKIILLAQSYMPAQDIHILVNPLNEKLSPWYEINRDIISPEYQFTKNELKSW